MNSFNRNAGKIRKRALGLTIGGCAGAAVATTSAEAAIIASGPINQTVSLTETDTFDLDIDSDSNVEYNFASLGGKIGVDVYGIESDATWVIGGSINDPAKLLANELIDATDSFDGTYFAGSITFTGEWSTPGTGYMGLRFGIAGNTHYGWIEITSVNNDEIVLNQWAYESTPNAGIETGVVPEPTTAMLMAIAAMGAFLKKRLWRRSAIC